MLVSFVVVVVVACVSTVAHGDSYVLQDNCVGSNLLDCFNFTTWNNGCGEAVDKDTATKLGMINTTGGSYGNQTYIGVESNNIYKNNSNGYCRETVQIESIKSYNSGLFVLNAEHMPYGCGVWPAWWTMGPNWPYNGEIDIVENINMATNNQGTLHVGEYCNMKYPYNNIKNNITGNFDSTNCTFQPGCSEDAGNGFAFGYDFDQQGGGAWAMEWTEEFIRMFFWLKNDIPSDLLENKPNPDEWGKPWSLWTFNPVWCNSTNFAKNNIYIDTYMCGWAGGTGSGYDSYPYSWKSQCADKCGDSCEDYVRNNPQNFTQAYWLINYLQVYQYS